MTMHKTKQFTQSYKWLTILLSLFLVLSSLTLTGCDGLNSGYDDPEQTTEQEDSSKEPEKPADPASPENPEKPKPPAPPAWKNRTYFVLEGNMSNQEGALCYVDENGTYHDRAFREANGKPIGNVLQDMYIANGKIYLITQNGPGNGVGGGGYFVVADEETLKEEVICGEGSSFHKAESPDGVVIWPQHLVVVSDKKAYVRYSTSDMEQSSGVKILNLETNELGEDIMDLYGPFPGTANENNGSTKLRMLFTGGKVFVPCGNTLKVLDPVSDRVVDTITIENASQIKGIVQTPDGNIWMAVAGTYTQENKWGPATFTSPARIIGISSLTNTIFSDTELPCDLPVATWSPHVGMCASPVKNEVFFWGGTQFNMSKVYKFNCDTKKAELFKDTSGIDNNGYGYLGVSKENTLYVGFAPSYMSTLIKTFDAESGTELSGEYRSEMASPSGIDFPWRFE